MRRLDKVCSLYFRSLLQRWPRNTVRPRPRVPKPQCRKDIERGRVRPAIPDGDSDQEVLWRFFRIFDENIEIPIFIKNPRIEQLIFEIVSRPLPVFGYEVIVRKSCLRILK